MATFDSYISVLYHRILHTLYSDRSYDYFILGHDYVVFADATKLCDIRVRFPVDSVDDSISLPGGTKMTKGPYVTIKVKDRIFEIAVENEFEGPDAIDEAVRFLKDKYGLNHSGAKHV